METVELIQAYQRKIKMLKTQIEKLDLCTFDIVQSIEAIKIYRNRIRVRGGEVKSFCHAIKN